MIRLRQMLVRLRHWEYWNSFFIYAPLYPYYLWLSIKARSFFFLTAANPNIRNGGFIMESKKDVYDQLPVDLYPATLHFRKGAEPGKVWEQVRSSGLKFPLVAKPDHGERGLAVKRLADKNELYAYAEKMSADFLVQEWIEYPFEAGIFYYRFPWEKKGRISGIVHKEPVTVTGDGKSSLKALILREKRYLLQYGPLAATHAKDLEKVLEKGERMVLMPYGNHSRGSLFIDISNRISSELENSVDEICRRLPGFHFGRLDIRYQSWEALEEGKDLSIIELNGSGSEPTHIYDPRHSLLFAWKEILRHWAILYRISKANNESGTPYLSFRKGRAEIRAFKTIEMQLQADKW